jgi:hypothetical protein
MPSLILTDAELELIQAAIGGRLADFTERNTTYQQPTTIKGEIIRNLIIGLPLPEKANEPESALVSYKVANNGVRIKGAYIKGTIDISDCFGSEGNGCPLLSFEECILAGTDEKSYATPSSRPNPCLNARHSKLFRLSFKKCKFGFIDISDSEILGTVEFEEVIPLVDSGLCRIEAMGTRIDGSFTISNTELSLEQKNSNEHDSNPPEYALNLKGAEISGDVLLRPMFKAIGGISISRSHIKGDLWADGAHLTAKGNLALQGQSARVDGVIGLTCLQTRAASESASDDLEPVRFHSEGGILLLGAEMAALELRGAWLQKVKNEENGLSCQHATIKQLVNLGQWGYKNKEGQDTFEPFESEYPINFTGAKILGSLVAEGARFEASPDEEGFIGTNLEVSGDLILDLAEANTFSIEGAKISGSLNAYNAKFSGEGFRGDRIEIGQDLQFEGVSAVAVHLRAARISQDIFLNNINLESLQAQDVHVDGNINLSGELLGKVSFQGAGVLGDFVIGSDKKNPLNLMQDIGSSSELSFEDATIARNLRVWGVLVKQKNRPDLLKEPLEWTKNRPVYVRKKKLSCYEGCYLFDTVFSAENEKIQNFAIISFVHNELAGINILLDGSRSSIDEVNKKSVPILDKADQAFEYLKFFSDHIWGPKGGFIVVESKEEAAAFTRTPGFKDINIEHLPPEKETDTSWRSDAFVVYAQKLFKDSFRIKLNGNIEMLNDEHLADIAGEPAITYISPFRIVRNMPLENWELLKANSTVNAPIEADAAATQDKVIGSYYAWKKVVEERTFTDDILHQIKPQEFSDEQNKLQSAMVKLTGARAGALIDDDGGNWGDKIKLDLEGFEYHRFGKAVSEAKSFAQASSPDDSSQNIFIRMLNRFRQQIADTRSFFRKDIEKDNRWKQRLKWLYQQYEKFPPEYKDFKPQPFEQVVKVFLSQGDDEEAIEILRKKLRLERSVRYFSRKKYVTTFLFWIGDLTLGYATSLEKVLLTFLISWLIGWLVVDFANYGFFRFPPVGSSRGIFNSGVFLPQPVLVLDAMPVSTIALPEDFDAALYDPTAKEFATSSPGGHFVKETRCGDEIESALYALDTLIPLIDLRQETKCSISSAGGEWPWRIAKGAYAIWGWAVTSAFVLAISGFVRRKIER